MLASTYAPRAAVHVRSETRTRPLRLDRVLARGAVLAAAALATTTALRMGAAAGPSELYLLVFALGAIALVSVVAWLFPFVGALLVGAAGTAVWVVLDATPLNAWLALAAFVAVGFLMRHWMVEATLRGGGTR